MDVITPPKKCTFNCVYCQLGETKSYVSTPENLQDSVPCPERILSDLGNVMTRIDLTTVDIVTFSGNGEPTLNLNLGVIAKRIKARIGNLPMAILTNSSLLHRKDVRRSLFTFDMVVAKLDAGDNEALEQINRPADKQLDLGTIIDSIRQLRKDTRGTLALEVMLMESVDGRITNVKGRHLENLADAISSIQPDIVQLEVPYRPSSESYVKQPTKEEVSLVSHRISQVLGEGRLWVYGIHDRRGGKVRWLEHKSFEEDVMELLRRRPCSAIDVSTSFGIDVASAKGVLEGLEKTGKVGTVKVKEEKFYFKS
ncbi:MAG: radical SAM protein [Candidatus Bathyarchaeota archaeon]|nr:radical SAM protein [Candidatus Bathyarchaeota archaeon]